MLPKFSIEASRLTITLLSRHAPGAVRQVDADDGRQQLRRQPDGERQREEERVQDRAVQVDVDGEDGEDQHQRHLHQEVAEAADAALELGLRRPQPQPLGDLAELGLLACARRPAPWRCR